MNNIGENDQNKPFVCHIPQRYLDTVHVIDPRAASPKQLDNLIRIAYIDFLSLRLNLDTFSIICENIWWLLILQKKDHELHDLADAAYSAGELSWYIRNIKEKTDTSVAQFLSVVHEYITQRDVR